MCPRGGARKPLGLRILHQYKARGLLLLGKGQENFSCPRVHTNMRQSFAAMGWMTETENDCSTQGLPLSKRYSMPPRPTQDLMIVAH